MDTTYILYLITFLGYPIIALIASSYPKPKVFIRKYLKWIILFFAVHNSLFLLGVSLKGDYPDYFIFSFEYLFFCMLVTVFYYTKPLVIRFITFLGSLIMLLGFLQGLAGIVFFIVVAQKYETDTTYSFTYDEKTYQTRRYTFGFATLDDTTYTFETYRYFNYLPFEYLVDETVFWSAKTDLNFDDENFKIKIVTKNEKTALEFSSKNEKKFLKAIE